MESLNKMQGTRVDYNTDDFALQNRRTKNRVFCDKRSYVNPLYEFKDTTSCGNSNNSGVPAKLSSGGFGVRLPSSIPLNAPITQQHVPLDALNPIYPMKS
jgi:hypothetical protein